MNSGGFALEVSSDWRSFYAPIGSRITDTVYVPESDWILVLGVFNTETNYPAVGTSGAVDKYLIKTANVNDEFPDAVTHSAGANILNCPSGVVWMYYVGQTIVTATQPNPSAGIVFTEPAQAADPSIPAE